MEHVVNMWRLLYRMIQGTHTCGQRVMCGVTCKHMEHVVQMRDTCCRGTFSHMSFHIWALFYLLMHHQAKVGKKQFTSKGITHVWATYMLGKTYTRCHACLTSTAMFFYACYPRWSSHKHNPLSALISNRSGNRGVTPN